MPVPFFVVLVLTVFLSSGCATSEKKKLREQVASLERQMAVLEETHARALAELRSGYERDIERYQTEVEALKQERDQLERSSPARATPPAPRPVEQNPIK